MKYIDAEKLKRFVGELKERAKRNRCDSWRIVPRALEEVEGFITSLQQEQPPTEREIAEAHRYAEMIRERDKARIQQEQPEVDLEEAARHVYESWNGGTMDDVRRDMAELGKVLNARKEK